jgi:TM2 domain-containing membrane protein YozV
MHAPQYRACPYCQAAAELQASHCSRCGQMFQGQPAQAYAAPMYGQGSYEAQAALKVPAGLCGLLLGTFGIHKFIMGYKTEGVITLLISLIGGLLTCGIASAVMHVIGMAEGIIYLTKTDPDFVNTYFVRKKGWL